MDTIKTGNRNSKILHADGDQSRRQMISDNVVEIHRVRAMEAPNQQRISATGRPFINATVAFTFPILNSSFSDHRATAAAGLREDEVGSDASSDLFEIETFSTQTSSCPIHCLCDSVDEDSNGERKFTPANGISNVNRSRLSISANDRCRPAGEVGVECSFATADGCDGESEKSVAALRPPPEGAGCCEGKRKSDGTMVMSCKPAAAKCMAEGPTVIPLRVDGRPLPAEKPRRGSSQPSPLVAAGG